MTIKEQMNEAYRLHTLSEQRKVAILQRAKQQKTPQRWMLPAVVMTAMALLFILIMQPPAMPSNTSSMTVVENGAAPNAIIAVANRKVQFQQILQSGEINDQAKMDYLRTSDWPLQLVFERLTGTQYKLEAEFSQEERTQVAALLFYMREYILAGDIHPDVVQAFEQAQTFYDVMKLAPILASHVLAEYEPLADEVEPEAYWFATLPTMWQLLYGALILGIVAMIMYNIVRARRYVLLVGQCIILAACLFLLTMQNVTLHAIDETAMVASNEQLLQDLGADYERLELIASAQFDSKRFSLVQLHESTLTEHALTAFDLGEQGAAEMQWMNADTFWITPYFVRTDGQRIVLLALTEGHEVARAELTVFTKEPKTYTFDVQRIVPTIQAFYLPPNDASFELKLYDDAGNRITK